MTEKIDEFRSTFQNIVSTSSEIREHMTELTQRGLTLDQISDELGVIFNDILAHLKKAFPPPDQAPSHEARQEMVTSVLDRAEQGLQGFARKHGMSEDGLENLRSSFDRLKPHVEKLVVITGTPPPVAALQFVSEPSLLGDLIEQHPVLFSTLVFSAAAMLIPESWFLRPLLSLMGYGPYGPIKGEQLINDYRQAGFSYNWSPGSPAAWAQRRFWGAAVSKGSWFAFLQRAGMKGISVRPVMGAIGGAIGAIIGSTPCFLARVVHP